MSDEHPTRVAITGIGYVLPDGTTFAGGSGASAGTFPDLAERLQAVKPADRRAMGETMQAAVAAAGDALAMAGLAGDETLLARTQIAVAGRCVERDAEIDERIRAELAGGDTAAVDATVAIMAGGLRPTLFLAQLPNLIAANISIVHGVRGRSQTFLGETAGGLEALVTPIRRVAAGDAERCLAGGCFSSRDARHAAAVLPPGADVQAASAAVFLLVESAASLAARGQAPLAWIDRADSGRDATASLAAAPGATVLAVTDGSAAGRDHVAAATGARAVCFVEDGLGWSSEALPAAALARAVLSTADPERRPTVVLVAAASGIEGCIIVEKD